MTIKFIHQDLLDEIIEKIGSKAIIECEPVSIPDDFGTYNIKIDTDIVRVHYHKNHLYLHRGDDVIAIDRFRFFEVSIL